MTLGGASPLKKSNLSCTVLRTLLCLVLLAQRYSCATNTTAHGALTQTKQVSEQIFDTGLSILNATYQSIPILNQTLPQIPSGVANTSLGAHAKATVDALSVRSFPSDVLAAAVKRPW